MKTKLLSAMLLMGLPLAANAGLSVEVGAGQWAHDPSGTFRFDNGTVGTEVDLKDTFGMKEEEDGYTYALFRHPAPLIPNVKIMNTSLSHAGSGGGAATITFGGQTYTGGSYSSNFNLDHTDITAFWNLWETGGLTLDVGLTARTIDGNVTVSDGTNTTSTDIDGTLPMLYAGASISPIDSIRLAAELNYIGSGDTGLTDTVIKIGYYPDGLMGLGIEAGTRKINLDLDDQNGNYSNIDFSGTFVGVTFKF